MTSLGPNAVVTICALVACGLAVRAMTAIRFGARLARSYPDPERRCVSRAGGYRLGVMAWCGLAGLLLLLALRARFDVLGWLTEIGREIARGDGWYALRRPVQTGIVAAIALAGVALLAIGRRRHGRGAIIAGTAVTVFVGIDALSLHAVDAVLGYSIALGTVRDLIVMALIGAVAGSAITSRRWVRGT